MATTLPNLPDQERETFADDLVGMGSFFIDPAGAARRIFHKWFWIGPVVLVSIISIIVDIMLFPMVQHVLEIQPMPANASPDQYQRGIAVATMVQHVTIYIRPLLIIAVNAVVAVILLGMCSVLSIGAKFRSLFNLVSGCSLIAILGRIATLIIVRAKGDVSTMAELRPPLGLDIFLPETTNKFVLAILGYFSIFQIWWIVMMVLILSAAFRITKGKAFAAVLPLIVLGVILSAVFAVFQR